MDTFKIQQLAITPIVTATAALGFRSRCPTIDVLVEYEHTAALGFQIVNAS